VIRRIAPGGVVTTLAGGSGYAGYTDGTAAAARFRLPKGVAVDAVGNLYVADAGNHAIRKITPAGVVSTLAGNGISGSTDGIGAAARFHIPSGLAVDAAGVVYVADSNNNIIRKIASDGTVSTLAGTAGVYGSADGTGAAAGFFYPLAVAVDAAGTVYVTEIGNNTVRKITSAGVVTTLAGKAGTFGTDDGLGSAARFKSPEGIAVDAAGNVYVADRAIRKITPAGAVTTIAGASGVVGSADGTAGAARFRSPSGIAVDATGNLFISDRDNNNVRKITPAADVTTYAGVGLEASAGSVDGSASAARFREPAGLAVIERAKADGSWSVLDGPERLEVPPDLAAALDANPPAADRFAAFPPFARKLMLSWVATAVRPETRASRVDQIAAKAARNERAQG